MSNVEGAGTPFSSIRKVYCQVCKGPTGKGGNEETAGKQGRWVYIRPQGVSRMTPEGQGEARVRVGLKNHAGPVGPEDHTHRLCYNGCRMVCDVDAMGNYSNPQFYPAFTGPEIMGGRGGVTGEYTCMEGVIPEKG